MREVLLMVLDFLTNQYPPENIAEAKELFKETVRFAWDGTAGPMLLNNGRWMNDK